MKKKLFLWLPVVLWMGVIFTFSSQPDLPSNQIDILDFALKKTAHMVEFGILTFLFFRAFKYQKLQAGSLLSLSYAFTDEIHQLFVPGRGGRLSDVLIDSLGIFIVSRVITSFIIPRIENKD